MLDHSFVAIVVEVIKWRGRKPICIVNKKLKFQWVSAGAILLINCRRFIITSADLNDYRYMQQNPELFSKEGIETVREYLISVNCLNPNEEVLHLHVSSDFKAVL